MNGGFPQWIALALLVVALVGAGPLSGVAQAQVPVPTPVSGNGQASVEPDQVMMSLGV
jgi:hypothetical protein